MPLRYYIQCHTVAAAFRALPCFRLFRRCCLHTLCCCCQRASFLIFTPLFAMPCRYYYMLAATVTMRADGCRAPLRYAFAMLDMLLMLIARLFFCCDAPLLRCLIMAFARCCLMPPAAARFFISPRYAMFIATARLLARRCRFVFHCRRY